MTSTAQSPNHREILSARSTITGKQEYLTSTAGVLNINGSIGGSPLPISGASTGVGVAILDSSGNQISSFGGGTQYTDGGTPPAHPIGGAIEFNNSGTWATVSVANPLPVSASVTISGVSTAANQTSGNQKTQVVDGSGNVIASTSNAINSFITNSSLAVTGTFFQATQPISGTVTANAGTNLNTSLLALETGGNLASIKTDVDNLNLAIGSTTSGQKGNLILGAVTTSAPTYSTTSSNPLSIDTSGNLRTSVNNTVTITGSISNTSFAVTNTGTFAVQATLSAETTKVIGTVNVAAAQTIAVTNAGTFASQATLQTQTDTVMVGGVNIKEINAVTPLMGNGVTGTGSQRITIASDNSPVSGLGIGATASAVPANANYIAVMDGSGNLQGQKGIGNGLNTSGGGNAAVGIIAQFDDVSPTSITENNFGNLRMSGNRNLYGTIRDAAGNERGANVNASSQLSVSIDNSPVLGAGSALVGKVGIDQTTPGTTNAVVDTPATSGGLSIVTGSVGATATAIKASAGQLYGYHLFNTTAAVAYVQLFNVAAASVTLGSTAPTLSIGIPASGGVTVNFDKGIPFATAISYACTTTRTGSSGATCDVNFFYK